MSSYPPPGGQPPFPPQFPSGGQPPFPPGGQPPGQPNPFMPPPVGGMPAYRGPTSRTSLLAVTSLIAGIVSPALFCMCIPTIIGSFIGLFTGGFAIYQINVSRGRLSGMPLAIIGVVLSLPVFFASLALAPSYIQGFREAASKDADEDVPLTGLARAEEAIRTDSNGVAHGNTPEAVELAREYSEMMLQMREVAFTPEKKKGISLSGGQFVTWCELHEGQCAFVVHVPSYRKFDDDAKESLAKLAWLAANATAAETLEPGDRLAVGLKGVLLYGKVMVGTVREGDDGLEPDQEGEDASLLEPFFPEEDISEPMIDLGAEPEMPAPAEEAATSVE